MSIQFTSDFLSIQSPNGLRGENVMGTSDKKRPLEQISEEDTDTKKKQKLPILEPEHKPHLSSTLPFSISIPLTIPIEETKSLNNQEVDELNKLFKETPDWRKQDNYVTKLKAFIKDIKKKRSVDQSIHQVAKTFYDNKASFGEEFKGKKDNEFFYKNVAKFFCLLSSYAVEKERDTYLEIASMYFSKWGVTKASRANVSYHVWLAKKNLTKGSFGLALNDIKKGEESIGKIELEQNLLNVQSSRSERLNKLKTELSSLKQQIKRIQTAVKSHRRT